jgi:hypothetical protein
MWTVFRGRLVRLASTDANEVGVGMVAGGFAGGGFLVGLRVSHPGADFLEDLFFAEAGIFQAADLGSAHGGKAC